MRKDDTKTEAAIFKSFATELAAAGVGNAEAWRIIQQWLARQDPLYRYRYRAATSAIWHELLAARRVRLLELTMPEHMRKPNNNSHAAP
jgi:hypothetical protein